MNKHRETWTLLKAFIESIEKDLDKQNDVQIFMLSLLNSLKDLSSPDRANEIRALGDLILQRLEEEYDVDCFDDIYTMVSDLIDYALAPGEVFERHQHCW